MGGGGVEGCIHTCGHITQACVLMEKLPMCKWANVKK